jgi:hypothetical protein
MWIKPSDNISKHSAAQRAVRITGQLHRRSNAHAETARPSPYLHSLDHRCVDHLVGLLRLLRGYRAHVKVPHAFFHYMQTVEKFLLVTQKASGPCRTSLTYCSFRIS